MTVTIRVGFTDNASRPFEVVEVQEDLRRGMELVVAGTKFVVNTIAASHVQEPDPTPNFAWLKSPDKLPSP